MHDKSIDKRPKLDNLSCRDNTTVTTATVRFMSDSWRTEFCLFLTFTAFCRFPSHVAMRRFLHVLHVQGSIKITDESKQVYWVFLSRCRWMVNIICARSFRDEWHLIFLREEKIIHVRVSEWSQSESARPETIAMHLHCQLQAVRGRSIVRSSLPFRRITTRAVSSGCKKLGC